jgi:hypothetical protein
MKELPNTYSHSVSFLVTTIYKIVKKARGHIFVPRSLNSALFCDETGFNPCGLSLTARNYEENRA